MTPGAPEDINRAHWALRMLPAPLRPYGLLARWDRPIGAWLLLLPCFWSASMAAQDWQDSRLLLLFAIGAVAMRGAGCTLNDILDRDLDARVARTRTRPLPSGAVSLPQAWLFLLLQTAIGLVVLLQLPLFAIMLGAGSLLLVALYPLAKRVTSWPQFILGLTFNWGALLGWAAVRENIAAPAFLLYCGAVMWTLVYDTIYAHQDRDDDRRIGVKSTALLFGARSRGILGGFALLGWGFFAAAGYAAGLSALFYAGLALALGLQLALLARWRMEEPADCLRKFRASREVGLLLWAAILLGRL